MTFAAQVEGETPERTRLGALYKAQTAIECGEDVRINDIRVDLRHPRLTPPGKWRAVGLSLKFSPDASSVRIGWRSMDRVSSGDDDDERITGLASVWLNPGDTLSIADLVVENLRDPVLMEADRRRAVADLVILHGDGTKERAAAPMSFADPLLMELDSGRAVHNYWRLELRLALLEEKYRDNPGIYEAQALSSLHVARELFDELHPAVIAASKLLAPAAISVLTIPHLAAAFGYAVGLAEAEFSARREVRAGRNKRAEGGRARAKQQQALADEWKAAALKIAKKYDLGPRMLTREALAMRIVGALENESLVTMPSRHSIVIWLQAEAEAPNGPLRSRRRHSTK
jgi:hypothetical protein